MLYHVDTGGQVWHAVIGGRIPFLPDFAGPTIAAADRRQLAIEILNRQISFIQTLCRHKEATFALRFVSRPATRQIAITMFAKCTGETAAAADSAVREAWRTVENQFPRGYPLERFQAAGEFLDSFQPFACHHVAEIRRPELALGPGAYVALPLAWSPHAMVDLCTALVHSGGEFLVSVMVRPTCLMDWEQDTINWMASRLREASDMQFQGFSASQRVVDEEARVGAELYSSMLRELRDPIVLKIHVAGSQRIPEDLIARLGTEITRPSESVVTEQERQTLYEQHVSRTYEAVYPQDEAEQLVARREVYLLETYPWGGTLAPENLQRIRYLVDARHANCAFRLPIAPSDRIDGVVVRAYSPFSRSYVELEPDEPAIPLGRFVHRGILQEDGPSFRVGQLARHALVAGFTGSGKTTTCMHMLAELWTRHGIPWLVLEPAKAEYRQLYEVSGLKEDLRVFTLGNEAASPFRLNPLEPVPGYPLEAHRGYLRSAFIASLPMGGPFPQIVERCLQDVYRGRSYDGVSPMVDPPTLHDLVGLIEPTVRQLGYDAETRDRFTGALRARLESLLMGNKGRMLGCCHGIPMDVLLERPTVLELQWITDPEENSLLLAVLLVRLYEYLVAQHRQRKQSSPQTQPLQHVTLFEEAHRLLSASDSRPRSSEDSSGGNKALDVFANMLAEIRAYGEGLIIADQIPGKLLADVMKNTDLKIAHTLRAPDDRHAMGMAMNLNAQQESYVGDLAKGQAALHYEGLEEPTLVQFPNFKDDHNFSEQEIDDAQIAEHTREFREQCADVFQRENECPVCGDQDACPFRDPILRALQDEALARQLTAAALATLAGGDSRRRFLVLASNQLRRQARVRVDRDNMGDYLRCCCVQVSRILLQPHAEDACLPAKELTKHLRAFVQCHEPLIDRTEDDSRLLDAIRGAFRNLCQPLAIPPSSGCDFCQRQCIFYHLIQGALDAPNARRNAIESLNDRNAARHRFPKACQDAAAAVVGTDTRVVTHAAYCFAVLLLESKGVSDTGMFRQIAEDLGLSTGVSQ